MGSGCCRTPSVGRGGGTVRKGCREGVRPFSLWGTTAANKRGGRNGPAGGRDARGAGGRHATR